MHASVHSHTDIKANIHHERCFSHPINPLAHHASMHACMQSCAQARACQSVRSHRTLRSAQCAMVPMKSPRQRPVTYMAPPDIGSNGQQHKAVSMALLQLAQAGACGREGLDPHTALTCCFRMQG